MHLLSDLAGFEWDDGNRNKNWKKHHVAWWECEQVFFNQPLYVLPDPEHSTGEQRFYVLGVTNAGRLLFLAFTQRKRKIRVISARDMSKKERKAYYEKAQENAKA
jgi:hypothetical protein